MLMDRHMTDTLNYHKCGGTILTAESGGTGGTLGPASKEAWEAAGSAYPPIAEHAVEQIA